MPSTVSVFFLVSYRGSHTEIFYKTSEQQKKGIDIFWGRKEKKRVALRTYQKKTGVVLYVPSTFRWIETRKNTSKKLHLAIVKESKKIQQFLG
jgi:hypothetical protein